MDSESGDSKRKSVYYYEWVELDKPLCNKGHMMLECVCGSIQCANEFPNGTTDPNPCHEYDPEH